MPPALFLPISREKWGPRRAGGPPGALRPEAPEKPRPPKGYAVATGQAAPQGGREIRKKSGKYCKNVIKYNQKTR